MYNNRIVHIYARDGVWGSEKAFAEIREKGVKGMRTAKVFKSRFAGDAATDTIYEKACAWARAQGYTELFCDEDRRWSSTWSKPAVS